MTLANASTMRAASVQVGSKRTEGHSQIHLDQGNGKCQSDRSQVIGGKTPDRAVDSLGHLGYLTTPPMKRDRSQILQKKIEKNESFEQILRESMISRYWNWNMKMRRSVVLTSRE